MALKLSAWPPLRLVLASGTVALPSVVGWVRSPGYVIEEPIVAFPLGVEWFSVCLPLLAAIVGAWPLVEAAQGNFLKYTRTRRASEEYVFRRLVACSVAAGVVFFIAVLLWGIVCFWLDPLVGHSSSFGLPPRAAVIDGTVWGAMLGWSPWGFCLGYAVWVGLWAALFATLAGVAVLMIPNLALALVLPLVLWFVDASIFQALGVGGMNIIFTVFPFTMFGQPWWMTLISAVLWLGILLVSIRALRARLPELHSLG